MIVTEATFHQCVQEISEATWLGVDTETSGLLWWKDRLFCILISTEKGGYYFNFNPNAPRELTLPRSYLGLMQKCFENPGCTYFIANAKFDLHMLANEGLQLLGNVWCLSAQERVLRNNRLPNQYGLDALAKIHLGEEKEDIESYIRANGLITKVQIPGKKKVVELLHFDQVPFKEMLPYGERDMDLHLRVGIAQKIALTNLSKIYPSNSTYGSIEDVSKNEAKLTKTLFNLERIGIGLRRKYTEDALVYEKGLLEKAKESFKIIAGVGYLDNRSCFIGAFDRLGLSYPLTEKGNPSFTSAVLEEIDNPVARSIETVRHHEKRIGSFYSSFLYSADKDDVIHANINQGGTVSGRMSYSNPNLQQLTSEEDEAAPFSIRGCFGPRPGFIFAPIDYKQQEYKVFADYIGNKTVIDKLNSGMDYHQMTMDLTGITRRQAKITNFMLLYGGGIAKLAKFLGVSEKEAAEIKALVFNRIPGMKSFIRKVSDVAKTRRYIRNWSGRINFLDDVDFSYVMTNHLIQGSCADITKLALNRCDDFLADKKSRMLVCIHDEILFELHESELEIVPKLQLIMSCSHKPLNGIILDTDVSYSRISWSKTDLVKEI